MSEYQFRFGGDPPLSVKPGDAAPAISGGGERGAVLLNLLMHIQRNGHKGTVPAKSVELVEEPIGAPIAALLGYSKIRNIVKGEALVADVVRERDLAAAALEERAWLKPVSDVLAASNVGEIVASDAPAEGEEFDLVVASLPEAVQDGDDLKGWIRALASRAKKNGSVLLEVASAPGAPTNRTDVSLITHMHERFAIVDSITPRIPGDRSRYFLVAGRPYRDDEEWETKEGTSSIVRISPDRAKVIKERPTIKSGCEGAYEREVFWLTRLAESSFAPALIHIDSKRRLIVTNWAGASLDAVALKAPGMYPAWVPQLLGAISDLQKVGCVYDDWALRRIVVNAYPQKEGPTQYQMALVGFGRCPMQSTDSSCGASVPAMSGSVGTRRTASDILVELQVERKAGGPKPSAAGAPALTAGGAGTA